MTDSWDSAATAEMRGFVADLLDSLSTRADLLRSVMDGDADFAERTETVLTALKEMRWSLDQALHEACMSAVDAGLTYEALGKWAGVPWGVLEGETESYRQDMADAEAEDEKP